MRILICVLLSVSIAAPLSARTKVGQPVERPDAPLIDYTYGLLRGQPQTRFIEPGKFELTFETREPTPPAMVYAGVNDITEELDYNRYRVFVSEDAESTEPRTQHRIVVDVKSVTRYMPFTPHENRITWRAEVYMPSKRSSRFFEGRVYFNPETAGDTTNIPYGPFIEQVTTSTAIVCFDTDRPSTSSVTLNDRTFANDGETTRHEILLTGLQADTPYEYRVTAGDTEMRPYKFTTAGGDKFEFAAMVDCREGIGGGMHNNYGVAAESLSRLTNDLFYRGADLILFAGDLINGYTTDTDDFINQLNNFRYRMNPVHTHIPVYEGMGNHEALTDSYDTGEQHGQRIDKQGDASAEAVFGRIFCNPENAPEPEHPTAPPYKENVYSFQRGATLFIMLNNNYWWSSYPHKTGGNLEGMILPNQINWLREQVKAADANPAIKTIFVAAQEPPFPNGGHTNDAMWWKGGDTNRDGKVDEHDAPILESRNEMWEIISSTPKTAAFITGDEHAYSRLYIDEHTSMGSKLKMDGTTAKFKHPIWQVTAGGAGAPFYDKEMGLPWQDNLVRHSTQPHYAFFRVDGDNVKLEAYSETGELLDEQMIVENGKTAGIKTRTD